MKQFRLTKTEKEAIKHLYFEDKQSLPMIADTLDRDTKTICYWVKRLGHTRNRSEAQLLANKLNRGQGIKNYRENNGNWCGGKVSARFGYVFIRPYDNDPFYCMIGNTGYILEHRYVMAEYLGRPLTKTEIVHHLNGIRTDNRISNLALVNRNNHPTNTLQKQFHKRIRDLEAQLAQQKFNLM